MQTRSQSRFNHVMDLQLHLCQFIGRTLLQSLLLQVRDELANVLASPVHRARRQVVPVIRDDLIFVWHFVRRNLLHSGRLAHHVGKIVSIGTSITSTQRVLIEQLLDKTFAAITDPTQQKILLSGYRKNYTTTERNHEIKPYIRLKVHKQTANNFEQECLNVMKI